MNREEVIRMAKEAGWSGLYITWAEPTGKPDWSPYEETLTVPVTIEQVERFAALVAAAKQEQCAKVCKSLDILDKHCYDKNAYNAVCACEAAIRALP